VISASIIHPVAATRTGRSTEKEAPAILGTRTGEHDILPRLLSIRIWLYPFLERVGFPLKAKDRLDSLISPPCFDKHSPPPAPLAALSAMDPPSEKHQEGFDSESLPGRPKESLKRYLLLAHCRKKCLTNLDPGCQAIEATVRPLPLCCARTIYPRAVSHIAMISIGGSSFN